MNLGNTDENFWLFFNNVGEFITFITALGAALVAGGIIYWQWRHRKQDRDLHQVRELRLAFDVFDKLENHKLENPELSYLFVVEDKYANPGERSHAYIEQLELARKIINKKSEKNPSYISEFKVREEALAMIYFQEFDHLLDQQKQKLGEERRAEIEKSLRFFTNYVLQNPRLLHLWKHNLKKNFTAVTEERYYELLSKRRIISEYSYNYKLTPKLNYFFGAYDDAGINRAKFYRYKGDIKEIEKSKWSRLLYRIAQPMRCVYPLFVKRVANFVLWVFNLKDDVKHIDTDKRIKNEEKLLSRNILNYNKFYKRQLSNGLVGGQNNSEKDCRDIEKGEHPIHSKGKGGEEHFADLAKLKNEILSWTILNYALEPGDTNKKLQSLIYEILEKIENIEGFLYGRQRILREHLNYKSDKEGPFYEGSPYQTRWDVNPKYSNFNTRSIIEEASEHMPNSLAKDNSAIKHICELLEDEKGGANPALRKILILKRRTDDIEKLKHKILEIEEINCHNLTIESVTTEEILNLPKCKQTSTEDLDAIIILDALSVGVHKHNQTVLNYLASRLKAQGLLIGFFATVFSAIDMEYAAKESQRLEEEKKNPIEGEKNINLEDFAKFQKFNEYDLQNCSVKNWYLGDAAPELRYTPLRLRKLLSDADIKLNSLELYFFHSSETSGKIKQGLKSKKMHWGKDTVYYQYLIQGRKNVVMDNNQNDSDSFTEEDKRGNYVRNLLKGLE